jgi:YHS domain-containing protein
MSWCSILGRTIAGLAALCGLSLTASAGQPLINVRGGDGIAIHGYDPVAYFIAGEPRKGSSGLGVAYSGAQWLFSCETNKRLFVQDPEHYLPAYGGYCAYGVAQGRLWDVDPQSWTILYDHLYLNCPEPIYDLWLGDPMSYIRQADKNWPRLTGQIAVQPQPNASTIPAPNSRNP